MKTKLPIEILFTFTFFLFTCAALAEIRFVSKTGSSVQPYTTWATASDSIQKCINICNNGDTVVVANGVYKEFLTIDTAITLLGMSMDSTVIDGRGLNNITVHFKNTGTLQGFNIIGKGMSDVNFKGILCQYIDILDCKISNCYDGIYFAKSSKTIKNVIMNNVMTGVFTFCMSDTCKPKLYNSVLIIHKNGTNAWLTYDGGQPTIENNIMVTEGRYQTSGTAADGIDYGFRGHKKLILKNNLISGFRLTLLDLQTDSSEVINNIISEKQVTPNNSSARALFGARSSDKIRNNVFFNNDKAIYVINGPDLDYNLYWKNGEIINPPYTIGENDIIADPMFIKDTLGYTLQWDYHLQAFSPGIDKGDPSILDVDGTRSDIGLYGGPLGEAYKYIDLPPAVPKDFIVNVDTPSQRVIISWKMNSEADFMNYNIYRSIDPGFIPGSTNKLAESSAAFYVDSAASGYEKLYYRITAIDSQLNESISGQLISVTLTDVDNGKIEIITDYTLYQNYPNPFNSRTRIAYGLRERGYVKLIVYTLTGEIVQTIVNGEKEAGFYETDIDLNYLSSGIYLYRIEVIGKNNMPVYMEMKKMVHLK